MICDDSHHVQFAINNGFNRQEYIEWHWTPHELDRRAAGASIHCWMHLMQAMAVTGSIKSRNVLRTTSFYGRLRFYKLCLRLIGKIHFQEIFKVNVSSASAQICTSRYKVINRHSAVVKLFITTQQTFKWLIELG